MSTVKEAMQNLTLGNANGSRPLNQAGTRGLMAFIDLLPLMPKEIVEAFDAKKIQYENVGYYDTNGFANTANGTAELFPTNGDIEVGVSNVSKGKLEAGKSAVIVGIMLEYSTAATGFTRAAIPAAMQADVVLKIDGKEIVKVGIQSFNQIEGESNKYFLELDGKIIPDQIAFSLDVKVASGGGTGAGTTNTFRATLVGVGVQRK